MAMSLNDFRYNHMEDSHLAMLNHQTPETHESFLAMLRSACPSPIKSVAGSVNYDEWGSSKLLGFLDNADFQESGLDNTFSMDFGEMTDFFQGANTVDGAHDLDPNPSDLPSSAVDVVPDIPLVDVLASQPIPTTIQQPLVATKNTGSPRKRNSKGKFECTALGCTKFVLAAKCKSQMCKRHCVTNGGCQDHESGGGKGNKGDSSLENSAPIPMASTDNNHWALSRPPSAVPLQPITSSVTNNTISPEKMFRTDMSPAHETAWREKKQAQLEVIESKALKAEYERCYQNQIVVIFWDTVGSLIKNIGINKILMHIIFRTAWIQSYTVTSPSLHGQCTIWLYPPTCFTHLNLIHK